jgi:hypothetical protein
MGLAGRDAGRSGGLSDVAAADILPGFEPIFGVTGVGWVIALIWAFVRPQVHVVIVKTDGE